MLVRHGDVERVIEEVRRDDSKLAAKRVIDERARSWRELNDHYVVRCPFLGQGGPAPDRPTPAVAAERCSVPFPVWKLSGESIRTGDLVSLVSTDSSGVAHPE